MAGKGLLPGEGGALALLDPLGRDLQEVGVFEQLPVGGEDTGLSRVRFRRQPRAQGLELPLGLLEGGV